MKIRTVNIGAAVLAGMLCSTSAMAIEDFSEDVAATGGGFVGLGVRLGPDYEGGDDYAATLAPFGRYNWTSGRYVSLGGTAGTEKAARLKANVIASDQGNGLTFGPLLQYRLGRDDVDNNKVDKMKDIDPATEMGAFVGYASGDASVDLAYAGDVSSEHDGSLVYLGGKYKIPVDDKFTMILGVHLTWADDDYMETYFGVSGSNANRSGLPKYKASSGFKDTGFNVTGIYHINDSWGLAGNVGYARMLNDAEDSPLVDKVGDKNQYEAVVAVLYTF